MTRPVPADRYPQRDEDVPAFLTDLDLPGLIDVHVHVMPDAIQDAVWSFFDQLDDPAWPVRYRAPEPERRRTLADLGVVRHTALAYAHKPGVAAWLNDHTLALAARDPRVIPSFTFYPEPSVDEDVARALERGGEVAKVHLQVGRFEATDPRLDDVWRELARRQVPIVLHASAVYGVEGGHEYCGADVVRDLLDRHPGLTIVVAHLGAPDFADFLRLAEEAPTLRMDTAMVLTEPAFLAPVPPALLPRLAAIADRILFGSDFPTIPHAYAAQLRGLAVLELDREALAGVLHDNAAALLRRSRGPAS